MTWFECYQLIVVCINFAFGTIHYVQYIKGEKFVSTDSQHSEARHWDTWGSEWPTKDAAEGAGTTQWHIERRWQQVSVTSLTVVELDARFNVGRSLVLTVWAWKNGNLGDSPLCSILAAEHHLRLNVPVYLCRILRPWQNSEPRSITNTTLCTKCGGAGHISSDCKYTR